MEQVRCFVAVELTEELKQALAGIQTRLKTGGNQSAVKWVSPDSIHLTLKFLGNIEADMTGRITGALEKAIREIPPFHLEVGGLGAFPGLKRVQVVWIGVSGNTARLAQLQQAVDSGLAPLGFGTEKRPFVPHLTLARVRENAVPEIRRDLGNLISAAESGITYPLDVEAIYLIRSQLTREGAIYSRISSILLKI